MVYLKKNTTLVLFFLLIISIAAFSGSAVYYQRSLTKLNDVIKEKDDQVKSMSSEIKSLQKNITSLGKILNIQLKREENLSEQFLTVRLEKEGLTSEKVELEELLNQTQSELYNAEIQIQVIEQELDQLEEDLSNATIQLEEVLDDIEDVCDAASSLNISDCEDYT